MEKKEWMKAIMVLIMVLFLINLLPVGGYAEEKIPPGHKIVQLRFMGGPLGGAAYQSSHAMATILNKKHAWIRGEAVEVLGSVEAMAEVEKNEELKKVSWMTLTECSFWFIRDQIPPYNHPEWKDVVPAFNMLTSAAFFVTLDPKIKTPRDFVGKRIGFCSKAHSATFIARDWILKGAYGITEDRYRATYAYFNTNAMSLADGMLDVVVMIATAAANGKFSPFSALAELAATRKVYYVGLAKEDLKKMWQNTGYKQGIMRVPAGAILPGQPEFYAYLSTSACWGCWKQADEEVVYEVVKTLAANSDELAQLYPAVMGLNPEWMGGNLWTDNPKEVHPGAAKFYKEKGVKIGSLWYREARR